MPPPRTKGPGRCASEGPCDPLAHKQAVKNPEKEGTNPPRSRRSLALTRARGGRDHPLPTSARSPTRAEKVCSRKTKGEKKHKAREAPKTLAASRPKEKASEGPRRIPKTHGAQNGTPRKPPRSGTHGQNGRNRQKRRDTKKKEPAKQARVKGCPVTT